MALLLLRAVFAGALLIQGMCYLREPDLTPGAASLGLISIAAGALLLVGLVTPIAGAVVALEGIGVSSSLLPACTSPQFHSGISLIFAATILVAIIILGPGAFSLDARLFGRREIIIPRKSNS
jgi:uncharacterized membrane protein YphA (DoxX/SURF4 family)